MAVQDLNTGSNLPTTLIVTALEFENYCVRLFWNGRPGLTWLLRLTNATYSVQRRRKLIPYNTFHTSLFKRENLKFEILELWDYLHFSVSNDTFLFNTSSHSQY